MLDKLIKFVLDQRLLVMVATIVLVVAGAFAWKQLPIDAFPDVTNVQVMILTEAPGLTPVDVEQQVSFPIELAMQGLPDVRQIRSLSKSTLSQVVVVFEDDVDIYFARQLVFERLQAAKEELPEGIDPEMGPISTGLGEIYQYTLESDTRSRMELRTIQDWLVAPQLRTIEGVNEVNSSGGHVKQYHILVEPAKLLTHGITLRDVLVAVENNNANAGGNFIVKGWEQAYVRSVGLIRTISDIEHIVLKAEDGTPIYLKNVAEVTIGHQTRQGAVTRDGRGETVAGMVIMLKGANSKAVVDRVKRAIPNLQSSLPGDVTISPFYDRTALIQACIRTVVNALMQGGIFVVVILFFFLGSLRASVIVALSLPLSALVTFILMGWQGVTANLMSLGGLAIAIGMIVDGSIVISENIDRHLSEKQDSGLPRVRIVFEAVSEVARPILFAILIIVIVLLPLFTLEEMEGKMFKPLATTLIFAMLGSLIVALTIVPVLSSFFISGSKRREDPFVVRRLKKGYLSVLGAALKHKWITLLSAMALFAAVMFLLPGIGTEFLPQLDEGAIAINVVRLPSASLDGAVTVSTYLEQRLSKFPEVDTVVTKTGRAEISEDPMGPEQSDLFIMLHPKKRWETGRSRAEFVAALNEDLGRVPGLRMSFSQPIALRVNELISGIKSDLAVKIFGPDLDVIRDRANSIAGKIRGIEGAEDVKVEQVTGLVQIEVTVDRMAIARHKINVTDINEIIETAVGGKTATTIIEGQKRFDAVVRFPERFRQDIPSLKRILVPTPDGRRVPLGDLTEIREVEAPAQISREENMRRIVVECNIRGRDMGSFVEEVQQKIESIADSLPAGYYLRFGGQYENQERAMKRLYVVVPISMLLIFLMLLSAFRSARSALFVIVNLPFAFVGGVLAIVLMNINLSVSAAIGFITLFGIAVENGIVLVTFFNQLRKQGLSVAEAVKTGCELRFRPLLMTALTTLLGLTPMIYATGSGSEIQRPLAAVVLGGLVSSTVLTLLVLPVLYSLVEGNVKKTETGP
ncbi:efflux RND transporter permease subunit [Thermodesulfobacteriota bacterium]